LNWLGFGDVGVILLSNCRFSLYLWIRPWRTNWSHGHRFGWSRGCANSRSHDKTEGEFQETASFDGIHNILQPQHLPGRMTSRYGIQ